MLPEPPNVIVKASLAAFSSSTIDIIVNNAGVNLNCPLANLTPAAFDYVFDINVRGALLMTRAVLPHLPSRAVLPHLPVYSEMMDVLPEGVVEFQKKGTPIRGLVPVHSILEEVSPVSRGRCHV